ncbi:Na(+)/H(+) antiporter subunit F1 [Cytobacillus sp. FSL W7-1323]|uniref:Na(+)/H(+) antiporter subunit F n=2 Tax=Cytobacillus TaxID=2675230 RepID=A0A248TK32_9BACI|nr:MULTISPECIES: Na(+)/H(+) antiporter subunit F1 [Cytobacillus]ASV68492.1 Na(+)/H(+) antiporter subunit F [Cytobacillus kochii]MBD7939134.1 Na(+)/H(+) antiporter subunit F1 [Cytobacillus stercorigallinarum]MDQ0187261.1 multicomponent Na+:H+ antiporter subunit F [Cytobacillus kochii]MEA1855292.1 Na(+)/H(+) antiporter subunit F1 [Cytobacillus sp. OWB-43]MED1604011.1 Na(+)/H(+) antiporter subunit F1 [Cytobacillus kochii]
MIQTAVTIAIICLALSMLALVYRIIKGPTLPDRIVALDAVGVNIVGIVALICIKVDTTAYVEFILLFGILAFIGTVAFSKYLEKGVIIDHDRDR